MTMRTTRTVRTFNEPFAVSGLDERLPAGVYNIDTDEELIEGLSFLAYRRIRTVLYVPGNPCKNVPMQLLTVDPRELDAALEQDQSAASKSA